MTNARPVAANTNIGNDFFYLVQPQKEINPYFNMAHPMYMYPQQPPFPYDFYRMPFPGKVRGQYYYDEDEKEYRKSRERSREKSKSNKSKSNKSRSRSK